MLTVFDPTEASKELLATLREFGEHAEQVIERRTFTNVELADKLKRLLHEHHHRRSGHVLLR